MERLEEQPPLKKIATDGEAGAVLTNSLPSHSQGMTGVQALSADSITDPSSSGQMTNEATSDMRVKSEKHRSQAPKTSAALAQVWKDELNSGRILVSLHDLFGESILSFIPAPEMYMFL